MTERPSAASEGSSTTSERTARLLRRIGHIVADFPAKDCTNFFREIAPEPTGHGLPLSKCEAYNVSMSNPADRVEIITSVQRRRRWAAAEKVRMVEETFEPGMTV